jgi:hypothetical protein
VEQHPPSALSRSSRAAEPASRCPCGSRCR